MANKVEGTVASVTSEGGLITDISIESLAAAPRDENVKIVFGGHETFGLYPSDHDLPDANMVAMIGDSGFVEIEIVGVSLSAMLGIRAGESVSVTWS